MTYVCGKCGKSLAEGGLEPHELSCPMRGEIREMPTQGKVADSVVLKQLQDEVEQVTALTSELVSKLTTLHHHGKRLSNHIIELRITALEQENKNQF